MNINILHGKVLCGPRNETLNVNEACLKIISSFNVPLSFYVKNSECFKCDYRVQGMPVAPNSETFYVIDTAFGVDSYFSTGKEKYCQKTNSFQDFGIYAWNISENDCDDIKIIQKPENFWINIAVSLCFFLGIYTAYWLLRFLFKYTHTYLLSSNVSLRELEMDLGGPNNREERQHRLRRQSRITSIDAFRGLAIILMIFANYGGGEYVVFKHSPWNGLTIPDLVFPWFVWIMGASIVFSLRSRLRMSTTRRKIFMSVLKRSFTLICLGLMLNSGKQNKNYLRICGVLQRLGVTYFVVATIEIFIAKPQRNEQFGPWYYCQDFIDSWMQWIIALCFVVTHELLTFLLNVPGCPTGYLGPGGFSEHSMFRNCTGGAAGYIDRLVFTDNHLYHHGTFVKIYQPPVSYDPEGILGTLTTIFCAFLGVHAGRIILSLENPHFRIRQWLLWAVFTGVVAGLLSNWSQNGGIIPVNKNLWSLSYVLACSSLAFLFLAFFYWIIDFTHFWSGFPLIYPGMNAIALYIGHSLLKQHLPWRWFPFTNTHLELLIMDITATIIWIAISYLLYKKNIFITL